MTENEEFIFKSILNQVRMGFVSVSEIKKNIIEEIEDNQFEKEISEKWAFNIIDKEYEKIISESKNWERPTDTEKLTEAFDELCYNNIIALHNAGYETSDAENEVIEIEKQLRDNHFFSDGYCFYHEQDLLHSFDNENSGLHIAFQKVDNSDNETTLTIGKNIVKLLTKKGFQIEWNNDVNKKIIIKNFKWQHLFNENERDLQDYDDVIELMLAELKRNDKSKFPSDFYLETEEIDNYTPKWTDIANAIENMKFNEDDPSFIVIDFKKPIHGIMYIQATINEDYSYDIELRTGNEIDFKHYRYNAKEIKTIKKYFKKIYNKKNVDYSKWSNVTDEFL